MNEKDLIEKLVKLKDNIGDKKIKNSIKDQKDMKNIVENILKNIATT